MTEDAGGRFALTPLGDHLRSDVPGSMFGLVQFFASEEHGAAWNSLAYAVSSGEPAFEHLYGCTLWEYLDGEPALNVIFSDAMTSLMSAFRGEIVAHLELDGVRTVADIGGAVPQRVRAPARAGRAAPHRRDPAARHRPPGSGAGGLTAG